MRIVSLLPSATEIVCALGLQDQLVGVTHECDYPLEVVRKKPIVTSSILPPVSHAADSDEPSEPMTARQIDEKVRAALASGESLYQIDMVKLRDLKPDLLITQALCDVCAVAHKAVVAAADALGSGTTVLNIEPTTLGDVLQTFAQVGVATGREAEADRLIAETQARWERVRERASSAPERPRTLLLEWQDPPFSSGHWNPELLQMAGGIGGAWDMPGQPSRTLTWDEIVQFAPEILVLIACGMDSERATIEAEVLPDLPGWFDLPCVRDGECYAADGNAYFNRPGPRLAESAEILATILHPEIFTEMLPPYAVQRFPNYLLEPDE